MWWIYLILALAGFQGLAMLVTREKLMRFDLSLIDAIQGTESDGLTAAAKLFTKIGSSSVVIPLVLVVAVVLYIFLKHRKELFLLIGGMLGSTLLNVVLKGLYERARPDIHRIVEETGYSFPSGHSMAAFTFYGLLTYLLWRHMPSRLWRGVLIGFGVIMIMCIGLSRVYLGVHYPSDLLGGYWVSACWLAVCIKLFRRLAHVRR
ncbi:undecaprenyl-diphosphatase [Paenibacillus phyllosphaerae]|uniref:Undecaprenyl-diphosphatase n=1 Tax=Paenibacillus phyllosphaerae TaxID=274593 RepID=A0A7W5B1H8_9BACL|nr:phosphatase PAP2 family protein [Paenibacillus phyllosphaerae]MBB3112532.1 undecaprenyl-diphosphatase [Paenibacillus phyllosphaerae]